jgi:olfactory receptor
MYFFLSNLSFTDICVSTITVPNMLVNIQRERKAISYSGCLMQVYFVPVFVEMENFLLAAMAYDHYVAICHPLRDSIIMNPCLWILFIVLSLSISTLNSLLHSLMVLTLSFCADLRIPHFFCELAQVLKLACSNTLIDNILIYVEALMLGGAPLSGIMFSYIHIMSSFLRLPSLAGEYNAFSTCGSHLSVVSLFYGIVVGVYISSAVTNTCRKIAGFHDVSCCPSNGEPLYLQLEKQRHKGSLEKTNW